ncbi:MAG: hypothetical protein ACFFDN_29920, partial [Candidatus Hodarchaeota archaeon]
MAQHTFGEIPDDIKTKYHFPLGTNIWQMFKDMGWDWLEYMFTEFGKNIFELSRNRLDESVYTARDVYDGKFNENQVDKTFTYAFCPPVLAIRSDLQSGTMKLLFGDSGDVTFLVIHDFFEGEIQFALNLHLEEGIPVDWWIIKADDEFFDRRHMKLGIKLKDIQKKSKNLDQAADRIIATLRDARNERTPQWNNSSYNICVTWCSNTLNMILESSSFEVIGFIFDGMASKYAYKLNDYWFNWWPVPAMIGSYAYAGVSFRPQYVELLAGLFTEHRLFLHPIEEENRPIVDEYTPEVFTFMENKWEKKGMIMPYQSMKRVLPNTRNKKIYKNADKNPGLLDTKFPDDPQGRFNLDNLNLTFEESLSGAYLDITVDSRKKDVSQDIIISKNYGRHTEFLWEEYSEESKAKVRRKM